MSRITLAEVTKSYGGTQIIKSFSGSIEDREFVTLLGPSGCGKTTMLRMIAGFEKPTSGEIAIDGTLVSGPHAFVPPDRRGIGMVFQSYAVWPHMDVYDNVAYPLKIRGVPRGEMQRRVGEALGSVHLSGYEKRMPSELSGGQQQRVALARALVSQPRVLLLDEPLSNLDAALRESMRFEIKEMQRRFGITVVYVTHDQSEAMAMSDRIIVFDRGEVQQADTPMNIYRSPANRFVAEFVGKINFLPGTASEGRIALAGGQALEYAGSKRGRVLAAVRPEDIRLQQDGGRLRGTLTQAYYLGENADLRVRIAGGAEGSDAREEGSEVRVTAPAAVFGAIAPGSQVWLDFDGFLVFDAE